jgi:uncharacterized lipoprotein YddW (UPF0748 family)
VPCAFCLDLIRTAIAFWSMPRLLHLLPLLLVAAATGCRSIASAPPAAAPRATVTVVEATLSAPNDAESRASRRCADLLVRHLTDAGITVRRMNDDDLIRRGLQDPVAILAYNPTLPKEEHDRIRAFLEQGGRLIVFYSSDPVLAGLLGFQLGPLQLVKNGSPWASFAFARDRPALLPARLYQTSRLARPAYPAGAGARVLAWWEDADGAVQDLPAWTLSDRGAWMSHILQDGDTATRSRLLLGLAGHFDPAVLRAAAWTAVRRAGVTAPYASMDAMLAAIRKSGGATVSLEKSRGGLSALYEAGRYLDVIQEEARLADRLAAACAATVPPKAGEFRAVWNSSGLGLYADSGSWSRTLRTLSRRGFTAVFPYAASAGSAQYPGGRLPQTDAAKAAGDPLAACCAAAQEEGLAVHAWKICWNLQGAPPELIARLKKAGRLQVSDTGETVNWLCPSRADNVEWELAGIAEIARAYPVQGIQLDYIRYPDRHSCFCKSCRAGFEKGLGAKVARWPADVLKAPLADRYLRWRAGQITRFVRLAKQRLKEVRPSAALSAAVYGWYPGCATSLGQDWGDWVKREYVAFVCPMNYTASTTEFSGWLRNQMPLATGRAQIVPGIGVTSISSRLNGLQTLDQILAARRAGAPGFILYDLNRSLEHDVLPLLSLGATSE